ncbi:MAG TPA: hypothetical protein VF432_04910 [Thermoanaerobaculia bacterium]
MLDEKGLVSHTAADSIVNALAVSFGEAAVNADGGRHQIFRSAPPRSMEAAIDRIANCATVDGVRHRAESSRTLRSMEGAIDCGKRERGVMVARAAVR